MFASRHAEAFLASLETPESTQERLLLDELVGPNAQCELGRRHGFASIRSVADFQHALPIVRYADVQADIERIVHGEQGVLTTEPVKRFFLTSGSTSTAKYIPVTSSFVSRKSKCFGVYWARVFADHPDVQALPMVTNFSDSGEPGKAPGGLPCSSESAYWAGVTRATQQRGRILVPRDVAAIADAEARYYALACILLQERFSVIMTLNPSTILLLFKKMIAHADDLLRDVAAGGLSHGPGAPENVRTWFAAQYGGNPARAAELAALRQNDGFVAQRIWTDLALSICWRSPMLAPYLELLMPHFGNSVAQRDYIMMASEAVMAVPLADGGSGGALAIGSCFFEFIPEDRYEDPAPPVLLPHELEVGRAYVVVLTNGAGLWRYDIGDVVRVVGMHGRTPRIEFLHRVGATSSLTGEKLTEDQVTAAMSDTAATLGLALESFTLAPARTGFPHYVAYVELRQDAADAVLAAFPRTLDEALTRHNIEYGSKRSSERLAGPELALVRRGSYEARRQARLAAGTSDSQIKPTHLTRDAAFGDAFAIDRRVPHAD